MTDQTPHRVIVVPHPEIASGYWAKVVVSGQPTEWVTDPSGVRRVFATKESAELAAYRCLVFHINGSSRVSVAPSSRPNRTAPPTRGSTSERDRVFANFKGNGNTKA